MRKLLLFSPLLVLGFTACTPFIANKPIEGEKVYTSTTLSEEERVKLFREQMRKQLEEEAKKLVEEQKRKSEEGNPILDEPIF